MFLRRKRKPSSKVNYQKKFEINTALNSCPYCSYNTPKSYNYERHIFLHHYNKIIFVSKIPKSILSYVELHKLRDSSPFKSSLYLKETKSKEFFHDFGKFDKKENNKYFSALQLIFDKSKKLNKYDEDLGSYYMNTAKIIGEGSFSKTFLGEDKYLKINVAILRTSLCFYDQLEKEQYILERIHGKGNYPQLYGVLEDENNKYFIESLMGPTLKSLFKICDYYFDLYTILNIGIDIIYNIEIFHNLGFLHRDLKPDNIVYGSLCYENFNKRNEIGLIDFSNAKILLGSNGRIKYSREKQPLMGNKIFSSTEALRGNDITKKDDIISIFYILIYFHNGSLPWRDKSKKTLKLTKEEIISIREKISIKDLCKGFPPEFIILAENVMKIKPKEEPNYSRIIEVFQSLKIKEEKKIKNNNKRFIWLNLLEKLMNNPNEIPKEKRIEIISLFNKYTINIREYLKYICLNS